MKVLAKCTIILASASIGRRQLLEKLGVSFHVVPSTINEDLIIDQNPYKMLQKRARAKAEDVAKKLVVNSKQLAVNEISQTNSTADYPLLTANYLVIAADSMAILEGKTYGKAKDRSDAQRIVTELMGKTHVFATATCITYLEKATPPHFPLFKRGGKGALPQINPYHLEALTQTRVTLRELTNNELTQYLSRYDFTRFAAGYTLNETPWDLVTSIDGSYTNVVGLPFEVILPILRNLKLL